MTDTAIMDKRSGGAIRFWAALGAACLVLQAYVLTRWILSDHFAATPLGPDPVPAVARWSSTIYEWVSIITLAFALVWFVRGIRQTGRIDSVRLLMLGWLSSYWLDPWLNFLRPMFTYNAYHFNRGCWCEFIPGWQAPNGHLIAEPLLIDGPAYFYSFAGTTIIAMVSMRKARHLGLLATTLAGFAGVWFSMGLLDIAATRYMGFDAWPIGFQAASFWGGHYYQFPIYEFILFPSIFVAAAFVLLHADADGLTPIERGVDAIASPRLRTAARVLAFVGLCNLLNFSYTTGMGIHAVYSDPWPKDMPSWLANGQCDGMTGRACGPTAP